MGISEGKGESNFDGGRNMTVRKMTLTFCFALKCLFVFVLGAYRRREKSEERKRRGREEKRREGRRRY
jgi:hypothetical protein